MRRIVSRIELIEILGKLGIRLTKSRLSNLTKSGRVSGPDLIAESGTYFYKISTMRNIISQANAIKRYPIELADANIAWAYQEVINKSRERTKQILDKLRKK